MAPLPGQSHKAESLIPAHLVTAQAHATELQENFFNQSSLWQSTPEETSLRSRSHLSTVGQQCPPNQIAVILMNSAVSARKVMTAGLDC